MKIIASDYDGTLFQENGTGISQEDRAAIVKFRTQGGIFGIVTGRDLCASKVVMDNLCGMLDFLICSTGAIICDGEGRIVSQQKSNNTSSICQIADFALLHNVVSFTVIDEGTRHPLDISGEVKHNYRDLKEFNNCTIWFKTVEDAIVAEDYIREHHQDSLTFFRNFECIEITPIGVTKASAIKELIKRFDSTSVFTIGDGVTDISMIQEFCGFAIGNANPDVKRVAKRQCTHVCDLIDFALNS